MWRFISGHRHMVPKCMSSVPPGSLERTDVSDSDAESLWRREIRGALQRGRRPAPRNQTSEASLDCTIAWRWSAELTGLTALFCTSLLSALEAAAGGFKSPHQRHQRWPGRHQAHRARPRRQRAPARRHPELSSSRKDYVCLGVWTTPPPPLRGRSIHKCN